MRRSFVFLATLVFACTLSAQIEPPKADEKWITFETDGFRFISNASPRVTQEIARNVLRMRAAVGQVTRLEVRTAEPTRIYVFSSEQSFAPYRDAALNLKDENYKGGFVGRGTSGDFILLRTDADRIVYHELTHQFVAHTITGVPVWFNEGLAEYYSTFRTDGDATHIGRPVADHVFWLRDQPLIPLRELFAITHTSPVYNNHFYAQSWALVHYLMTEPGRRAKLNRFLTLLGDGKSVDEAFTGAFAMQVQELEQALRAYIGGESFHYNSYKLGEIAIAEVPEPVAMPHDAVLQQLGYLLVASNVGNAATAERFFNKALAVDPKNALAYTGLGRVYDATGRTADADAAYAKAVQLGRTDAEVYLAAGKSLMFRRPSDEQSHRRARTFFQRATQLDPKSSPAWSGLGWVLLGWNSERRTAIAAFEKSLKLDPANREASFHLAKLLARVDDARKLATLALTQDQSEQIQVTMMAAEVAEFELEPPTALPASFHQAMANAYDGKHDEALTILDGLLPTIRDPAIEKEVRAFREEVARMKKGKKK